MIEIKTLEAELHRYMIGWRAYEKDLIKQGLKGPLKATAMGLKVADKTELQNAISDLLPLSEQMHVGTVDDRFIATFVLKKPLAEEKIHLIKVLERRPGSDDPLGFDHVDFYIKDLNAAEKALSEARANWEKQSNKVHAWLSIRFGEVLEYEAKFVDHTVLYACIQELTDVEKSLLH